MGTDSFIGNRLLLAIFLLLCASRSFGVQPDSLLRVPAQQQEIRQMLSYINQLRTQHGLSSLTVDARLCQAARQHAEEMAQYNYFSHRGRRRFFFASSSGSRATASGYQWKAIAENICAGYQTVPAAFQSWVLSAEHYRNLTDARYRDVGIGVARTSTKTYWVLLLALPWNGWGDRGTDQRWMPRSFSNGLFSYLATSFIV